MYTDHPELRRLIRDVADFPKPPIVFRDIQPLLAEPMAFHIAIHLMLRLVNDVKIDYVAGFDARGFIFAAPLAKMLRVPLILIRKSSKLPPPKRERTYTLEYGTDTIAIGEGLIKPVTEKPPVILVVDDVLATGGTMQAGCELIKEVGGLPIGLALIEIEGLGGREKLDDQRIETLLKYPVDC